MEKYIKQTIDAHYTDDFIKEKLYLILPKFIEYYGEDIINTLVNAIRSTTVHLCKPYDDFQKFINLKLNLSMDMYYNKFLNSEIINQSNGLSYSETSYVIYDEDTDTFINKGKDRKIIFIKSPVLVGGNENKKATDEIIRILIHEFIIRMKSNRLRKNRGSNFVLFLRL